MADTVRTLSAQLAQDPQSLVFLRLGELLRRKGRVDAAHRVALAGLERHPHNADAHDLYARILADKHDYERAFDEWDMAIRIAPRHLGALKGLAFLYFKVGDIAQAEQLLATAQQVTADDASIAQALAMVRGATGPPAPGAPTAPPQAEAAASEPGAVPAASPAASETVEPAAAFEEARVFAGLDGAQEGLLLVDGAGRVIGGALRTPAGEDAAEQVAAHLAGVSREASRAARLLSLGSWIGLSVEGQVGHMHLCAPRDDAVLLLVRDRAVPLGRLAMLAQRAAHAARQWLERSA